MCSIEKKSTFFIIFFLEHVKLQLTFTTLTTIKKCKKKTSIVEKYFFVFLFIHYFVFFFSFFEAYKGHKMSHVFNGEWSMSMRAV